MAHIYSANLSWNVVDSDIRFRSRAIASFDFSEQNSIWHLIYTIYERDEHWFSDDTFEVLERARATINHIQSGRFELANLSVRIPVGKVVFADPSSDEEIHAGIRLVPDGVGLNSPNLRDFPEYHTREIILKNH